MRAHEMDGGAHRGSRSADPRRDDKLRRLGNRVVRVDAALVSSAPDDALAAIRGALPQRKSL